MLYIFRPLKMFWYTSTKYIFIIHLVSCRSHNVIPLSYVLKLFKNNNYGNYSLVKWNVKSCEIVWKTLNNHVTRLGIKILNTNKHNYFWQLTFGGDQNSQFNIIESTQNTQSIDSISKNNQSFAQNLIDETITEELTTSMFVLLY